MGLSGIAMSRWCMMLRGMLQLILSRESSDTRQLMTAVSDENLRGHHRSRSCGHQAKGDFQL